ncbi:MAG: ABC transporter ATP-binding protein [Nitrospirae bacterium]|nr:ABC transporter ATP-binding protein [Nitrospirota bacterium]
MQPFIRIRGLHKSFTIAGGSLDILKGIDLDINEGEMLAIMGPSGVGKSTFLHILGALDRPTAGEVFYGDVDITGLKNDTLANFRNKAVGFVFQFHHLLPEFTALENTMMPALIGMGSRVQGFRGSSYKEILKNAEGLLDELGIYERRDHKPGELSGGEQQRVAVARALILAPKVVLADEPTGNLDTHTGEELFDLMVKLNKKGITFIVVTHNETLAERCSRIVRMLDGKIAG